MDRFVHVMPLDDVIRHEGTPDCVCGPGGQAVSALDVMDESGGIDGWDGIDDAHGVDGPDGIDGQGDVWPAVEAGGPHLAVGMIYHHYPLRPCHEWEACPEL
ncbi:hypothetical protein N5079_12795 [Planotetraspora sp. A-T 1434]|uniref:hypothetical protein n=1 Tax=Planotetraspora sp. A-T 1434 TaxID=2979219 RepID=UPI0021C18808|nr:hypothetical protein [Planotetraspora sp. A-T 1434]MCT9931094.1 hypothetical protein [Planotetraspora sp. A-T 1434]